MLSWVCPLQLTMVNETVVIVSVSVALILLFLAAVVVCVWAYVCFDQGSSDIYPKEIDTMKKASSEPHTHYHPKYSTASRSYGGDYEQSATRSSYGDQLSYREQQPLSPIQVQPALRGNTKPFKSEPDLSFTNISQDVKELLAVGRGQTHNQMSVPDMLDNELELDEDLFDNLPTQEQISTCSEEREEEREEEIDSIQSLKDVAIESHASEDDTQDWSTSDVIQEDTLHEVESQRIAKKESIDELLPPLAHYMTTPVNAELHFIPTLDDSAPLHLTRAADSGAQIQLELSPAGEKCLSPLPRRRKSGRHEDATDVIDELTKLSPGLKVSLLCEHFQTKSSNSQVNNEQSSVQTSPAEITMNIANEVKEDKEEIISPPDILNRSIVKKPVSHSLSPLATTSYKATDENKTNNGSDIETNSCSDQEESDSDDEMIEPLKLHVSGSVDIIVAPGPPKRKITPAHNIPKDGFGQGRFKGGLDPLTIIEEEEP